MKKQKRNGTGGLKIEETDEEEALLLVRVYLYLFVNITWGGFLKRRKLAKEAQEGVVVFLPTFSFSDNEENIYRKHCGIDAKIPRKYQGNIC